MANALKGNAVKL